MKELKRMKKFSSSFIDKKIRFLDIVRVVSDVMAKWNDVSFNNVEELIDIDRQARILTTEHIKAIL